MTTSAMHPTTSEKIQRDEQSLLLTMEWADYVNLQPPKGALPISPVPDQEVIQDAAGMSTCDKTWIHM